MLNFLLYFFTSFIIFSFVCYIIMIMFGKMKVTSSNGFDTVKSIISEYDLINVIETKSCFTVYDLKRKIIKLNTKCYYGNDVGNISLGLIEAGMSILDTSGSQYINLLRYIFPNLKVLYIFPIISLFINHVTYTVSDAKVSLLFLILFSILFYIFINIKSYVYDLISDNLSKLNEISKQNSVKILNFINKLLFFDKVMFVGQFLMILRFIVILMYNI